MKIKKPSCGFHCDSKQCLLESSNPGAKMIDAQLPLAIPTKTLSLFEEHVPERLLDVFIQNNNPGATGPARMNNMIEANVEEVSDDIEAVEGDVEEKAEAIQLSASFINPGQGYEYNVQDISKIEQQVPTYIQITQVPQHGNLVIKKFGEEVVLNQGDFVETAQFKNFTYDQQGMATSCGTGQADKCKDTFSYMTFGQWVGKGRLQ
jgi:hypothetical protein